MNKKIIITLLWSFFAWGATSFIAGLVAVLFAKMIGLYPAGSEPPTWIIGVTLICGFVAGSVALVQSVRGKLPGTKPKPVEIA